MKKILISDNPWQTGIAVVADGLLQNIYFESHTAKTLERSFFKGVITKIVPGIQTAFVDIGQEKAGFLHISEIDRELAISRISEQLDEEIPRETSQTYRQPPDITKILTEGEHVLVQVSKEPIYEKGAKLTTCFTLPGRFIVLMPNIPRIGVSKKIENRDERVRLKEIVLKGLPEGMGAIIRTTSENRKEAEIIKDVNLLVTMWEAIQKKFKIAEPGEKIYEDLPLQVQVVRDHLDDDVEVIITNSMSSQKKLYKIIKQVAPEFTAKLRYHKEPPSLFDEFNVTKQLDDALQKKVQLKSGGSLIIESTEAMTVVDVNTGKFVGKRNLEDTIFQTNLEASQEIVRQLRLRNIGGIIVIDFIDMASVDHQQQLILFFEKTLKERDKFQSVVLKVSEFGLVQMTRKRSGKALAQQLLQPCPVCTGTGYIKSLPTRAADLLYKLKTELQTGSTKGALIVRLHPDMFNYLTTVEYETILSLEKEFQCDITLASQHDFLINQYKIEKV